MNKTLYIALFLAGSVSAFPGDAQAQDEVAIRQMFEAGQYQQVVDATTDAAAPDALYVAAQSRQKLGATNEAWDTYGRLSARSEADVWHFIGLSGQQLLDDQTDSALAAARQAVAMAGDLPDPHYQVGLVLAKRRNWRGAAEAFDRAAGLNPSHAYAHYYGGLMHYQSGRPDRMAIQFEQFLKLAPDAPERPEVLQIMRTVRGR
jgi:tetratricopeptide (TPR) repeat protein